MEIDVDIDNNEYFKDINEEITSNQQVYYLVQLLFLSFKNFSLTLMSFMKLPLQLSQVYLHNTDDSL